MTETRNDLIAREVPLAPLSSWQVGGPAEYFAQPTDMQQLIGALTWARSKNLPVTVLGGGTNVLISDRGVRGLVVALRKFSAVDVVVEEGASARLRITCLSGTSKAELLKIFLKHKLAPALFMAGLPGDVGGGIVMNAGVGEQMKPREFVEITDWIEVLRINERGQEIVRIQADQLEWSYRHCKGWGPGVIVRVGLSWPMEIMPDVLAQVRAANLVRAQKQPLDLPSCGSVFINPPGHTSGRLIEQAGLKGFTVGGAKVSEKHANFIVNFNKATALDISRVIEHVRSVVLERSAIHLRTEVVYLGEW